MLPFFLFRFEGRDGDYSPKARLLNYLGINLPFDRHDWTVDRCGTEQKYIIDYYATGEDATQSYNIDARSVANILSPPFSSRCFFVMPFAQPSVFFLLFGPRAVFCYAGADLSGGRQHGSTGQN